MCVGGMRNLELNSIGILAWRVLDNFNNIEVIAKFRRSIHFLIDGILVTLINNGPKAARNINICGLHDMYKHNVSIQDKIIIVDDWIINISSNYIWIPEKLHIKGIVFHYC